MNSVNVILNSAPVGPTACYFLSRQMCTSPDGLFLLCELTALSLRKVVVKLYGD